MARSQDGKKSCCSVVKVPSSPCFAKVLTGNLRKLKDSCADFYNFAQEFNGCVIDGLPKIKKLAELVMRDLEKEYSDGTAEDEVLGNEIQELCNELQDVRQKMEEVVKKMKQIVNRLKPLTELMIVEHNKTSSNCSLTEEFIPMQTWPLSKFSEEMESISAMYEAEFSIKNEVISNICQQQTTDNIKLYVILWKYQSQTTNCTLDLEGLVVECGLKNFEFSSHIFFSQFTPLSHKTNDDVRSITNNYVSIH